MEAARLSDEGATFSQTGGAQAAPAAAVDSGIYHQGAALAAPEAAEETQIEEVLLCSGGAEVLYEWQCASLQKRMHLLAQIEYQVGLLSNLAPIGRFDRLELVFSEGRMVCQILPDRRLVVRSRKLKPEVA